MEGIENIDALIVDEAGQSIEAETLLAFQHYPSKVLLVGDTKQLPATAISTQAVACHYDWSMMHRLQDKCAQRCSMLSEQYRMNKEICSFPSAQYYDGRLVTSQVIETRPPLNRNLFALPYNVFNILPKRNRKCAEETKGSSKMNSVEAEYVVKMIEKIRTFDGASSIGVITFYAAQRDLIDRMVKPNCKQQLQISSVDGFQGDECDIIIVSCVRANRNNSVGFVSDERRLNVAITRAKHMLIVLGSIEVLRQGSSETKALVDDAAIRGLIRTEEELRAELGMNTLTEANEPVPKQNNFKRGKQRQPKSGH